MSKVGKTYIDIEEFQKYILNYTQSKEMRKMFDSTIFKDPLCYQAMQHGLIWASLLTSNCSKIIYIEDKEEI